MTSREGLDFIHRFQKVFDLIRAGKIKGIQLRLDQKPGETVATHKRRAK